MSDLGADVFGDQSDDRQPVLTVRSGGSKSRRLQTPEFVKGAGRKVHSFYGLGLEVLDPMAGLIIFGLFNGLLFSASSTFLHKVVVGTPKPLVVAVVELTLFVILNKVHVSRRASDGLRLGLMALISVVMAAVVIGFLVKFNDLVWSLVYVTGAVMCLPGIVVAVGDKLHKEHVRHELETELAGQFATAAETNARADAVLNELHVAARAVGEVQRNAGNNADKAASAAAFAEQTTANLDGYIAKVGEDRLAAEKAKNLDETIKAKERMEASIPALVDQAAAQRDNGKTERILQLEAELRRILTEANQPRLIPSREDYSGPSEASSTVLTGQVVDNNRE